MLPFLAQGAAMAIEDAAVLTRCIGRPPTEPTAALRAYEAQRSSRTASVQRSARQNAMLYHWSGPLGRLRDKLLTVLGGENLLLRYDWIYDWKAK
jgi:salicylate hydroxylase